MPVPNAARRHAVVPLATGLLLVVALLGAPSSTAATPSTPTAPAAPGTTVTAASTPAGPAAPAAVAPPGHVDGVRVRVQPGGHRVSVTWDPPSAATATTGVTVCRVDGTVVVPLATDHCGATLRGTWSAGGLDDTGATPGHTYTYAVVPDVDPAAVRTGTAAPSGSPVTVTVARTARSTSTTATKTAAAGTGSVAGVVRTTSAAAVPGAVVSLLSYRYPDGQVLRGSAVTAADGSYRITGLDDPAEGTDRTWLCVDAGPSPLKPAGGLTDTCWRSSAWDGLPDDVPYSAADVVARNGVDTTGVDVVLPTGATVSGRVTAGGVAVVGASVYALGAAADAPFRAVTGSDGRYVLSGVPAGVVTLCVDPQRATAPAGSPGYAAQCANGQLWDRLMIPPAALHPVLTAGSTRVAGFDLAPGAGVTGVVSAPNAVGLAGVQVYLQPLADAPLDPFGGGGGGLASTGGAVVRPDVVTGASGRWTVTGVEPGRYAVCFETGGVTGGPSPTGYVRRCAAETTVSLTRGAVASADTTLQAAGGLSGTVKDDAGAALAGARVLVLPPGSDTGYSATSAVTDASGRWTLDGVAPGDVVVCVEASAATGGSAPRGSQDQCSGRTAWNGVDAPPAAAARVTVVATRRTAVPVALPAGGAVTGTVVGGGAPVAGAQVTAWVPGGNPLPQRAVTAADGTWTLRGLGKGRVVVCVDPTASAASPWGGRCTGDVAWQSGFQPPSAAASLAVVPGATTAAGRLVVQRTATVAGTVTATDGGPLAGVAVSAQDGNYRYTSTTSGSDGRYLLTGITGTTLRVCFSARSQVAGGTSATGYRSECWQDVAWDGNGGLSYDATVVAVAPGAAVTGIDAALAPSGALAGRVVADGTTTGVAGVGLVVFSASGSRVAWGTTGSDGSYRVTGLDPGTYQVCTYAAVAPAPGGSAPTCAGGRPWRGDNTGRPPTGTRTSTVAGGAVTSVPNLAVRPGGALAGTVRTDGGSAVPESPVAVYDAAGLVTSTLTSADGGYVVTGLEPGGYQVCFRGTGYPALTAAGLLPECAADVAWSPLVAAGPAPGSASVAVTAGTRTSGVDAALAPGGALAGTITEGPGGPGVGGASITVFDAATGQPVGRASTRTAGSWRATGLPAGRLVVCANAFYVAAPAGVRPGCNGDVAWDGGSGAPVGGVGIDVTPGTVAAADVALPLAAGVAGTLTAAGGGAVPTGYVSVFGADGGYAGYGSVGSDGRFVARNLPAGDYRVCAQTPAPGPRGGGYLPACAGGADWNPQGGPPAGATVFHLSVGNLAGPADIVMAAGSGLVGTLTDATSGTAVGSTSVTVFDGDGARITSAFVDNQGGWVAAGLRAGTYAVCADGRYATGSAAPAGYLGACWRAVAYDGYQLPARATRITLAAGAVVRGIAVTLPRAGGVSGRITADGSGAAVVGARVSAYTAQGVPFYNQIATTAADGTYTITGLAPASLTVCVDASSATAAGSTAGLFGECWNDVRWTGGGGAPPAGTTAVTVAAGVVTAGIDAGLAPSAAIRGRVTAASGGRPLAYAQVQVFTPSTGRTVGYTSTAQDGTYVIGGLAPGRYVACVYAGGQSTGPTDPGLLNQCYRGVDYTGYRTPLTQATTIVVKAGLASTGIDFALRPGAAVAGTVTDDSGATVDDVVVYLFQDGAQVASTSVYRGAYRMAGLSPGTYQVCFDGRSSYGTATDSGYLSECADDVAWSFNPYAPAAAAGSSAETVTAGAVTTVDAVLTRGGGMTGTVTMTPANTGQTAYVQVFAAGGSNPVASATGDFQGNWSVRGLPAGTYTACIDGGMGTVGWTTPCWDQDRTGADPTPIVLTAGQLTSGIDFDIVKQ